jgi:hypothetical protein
MSTDGSPGTLKVMGDAFASLTRSPFRTLVLLYVLIAVTPITFGEVPDGTETALSIVLFGISIYIQIAIILAAGRIDPEPSADKWLVGAIRRRCFWRFVGTSLVIVLGLFAGALLLVVGVFFIGALVGLAQSACVLERRLPMDAVNRSARLANPARVPVGIVFGLLVLLPAIGTQLVLVAGWTDELGFLWPVTLVVGELISAAGTIALTRMFVALGGEATPALDRLAPAKAAPPP